MKRIKEVIRKIIFIILGNLLCVLAFNLFFSPNHLLSGGIGGIALMVQYLKDIPSGITMFILNVPIFIIGARMVDRDFALASLFSMLVFSSLLTITNKMNIKIDVDDILVGAIVGGLLNGAGMGILFRNKSSQGGFDIVAIILKRKYNVNISSGLMLLNTIIMTMSSRFFGLRPAVYTLISMYIAYQVLDRIQTGFNVRKNIIIISDNYEEIGDAIIKELGRGVTYIDAVGGYRKKEKKMVYCIVTSKEVAKLKDLVKVIDQKAFLSINDVVEVEGRGFVRAGI